ncbi:MAG: 50S ribosomal protein L21 [Candidatus Giovannonibacteria bacterium]|nr:MAG: 50S ribosomal protein L21 [Candidatus Giovannonibacteria bacterium]
MKIAVIETGGKQYLVFEGQKIQVEKNPVFDKVLLLADGDKIEIGKPYLAGKKVTAEIIGEKRLPKVTIFKYHSKTRYRKKKGHRQEMLLAVVKSLT